MGPCLCVSSLLTKASGRDGSGAAGLWGPCLPGAWWGPLVPEPSVPSLWIPNSVLGPLYLPPLGLALVLITHLPKAQPVHLSADREHLLRADSGRSPRGTKHTAAAQEELLFLLLSVVVTVRVNPVVFGDRRCFEGKERS